MRPRSKGGFDRFFADKKKNPQYAETYRRARREIDAIDGVVRVLDSARKRAGMSKAELARQAGMSSQMVRRFFTAGAQNPTLATVARLAGVLGFELKLAERTSATRSSGRAADTRRPSGGP